MAATNAANILYTLTQASMKLRESMELLETTLNSITDARRRLEIAYNVGSQAENSDRSVHAFVAYSVAIKTGNGPIAYGLPTDNARLLNQSIIGFEKVDVKLLEKERVLRNQGKNIEADEISELRELYRPPEGFLPKHQE